MSVSISSRRAEFFSVCASVATVTSCVAIIATVYFEKKALQSYYLKLVIRLLASDLSLGVIIIFYYIMQGVLQIDQLRDFCKIYLPAVIYFYLASFGWTIMLAQRFRTTHAVETKNRQIKAPLSLKWVWAIPSISALIILICNFTIPGGVSVVEDGDSNTNRSCSFDHSGVAGMTVDILCFQIPMIVTILADLYCYSIGLYALRNTPRSVRSRQERRAGGYLAVLLLVWIPAFLYNIKALHQRKNNENGSFQDAVVFLSALQV